MDKHLSSKKHQEKHDTETLDKYSHICSKCNRTYSTYSGLWKHQKKCTETQSNIIQQSNVVEPCKEEQNINIQENTIQMEIIDQTERQSEIQRQLETQSQSETQRQRQIERQSQRQREINEDFQTKIKMNIIKILLDHVNRDELNKIIDEIYDEK
jgi:hypothetical protein